MSDLENNDLNSNICVPEDTFEQFQAVTAGYEEEEFITLSDIVEPPRPTLDLNACLDEIQDDIDIVTEQNSQCDESVVTEVTSGTCQELLSILSNNDTETASSICTSIENDVNVEKKIPQSIPEKRGKKKKSKFSSVALNDLPNLSNDNITSDRIQENLEVTNINCSTSNDVSVVERLNHTEFSEHEAIGQKSRQNRHSSSRKPKTSEHPLDATLKPCKRGRPRKVNKESNKDSYISPEVLSSETEVDIISHPVGTQEVNVINSALNYDTGLKNDLNLPKKEQKSKEKIVRKRGRPKKYDIEVTNKIKNKTSVVTKKRRPSVVSDNEKTMISSKSENKINDNKDNKCDEIELQLLRMLTTPTKELEEKANVAEIDYQPKPAKKRGRPKKNKEETQNEENTVIENNLTNVIDTKLPDKEDDDVDDICLSSLKKHLRPELSLKEEDTSINTYEKVPVINSKNETRDKNNMTEVSMKPNTKKTNKSDFEYNVDTIASDSIEKKNADENVTEISNPENESPSKRPIRRKAKKILHYDEGSDEDPFANMELSDDDDLSGRRGGYSDDEYIPGKRKKKNAYLESESSMSGSDDLENNEVLVSSKLGKKTRNKSEFLKKKWKQNKKVNLKKHVGPDITSTAADTTTQNDEDLEHSHQSLDLTNNENSNQKSGHTWGGSHEFENFIAQRIQGTNLKIKKLTGTTSNENAITPLEIPVLDPNEPKKGIEVLTQTNKISTRTVEVQTTSPFESTMKTKVPLTKEQSERACEFLKGIVKNTSELGQLMIQKSEDFIQKKINIKTVTDTSKMDYCVKKSFLLFKLAKHNLIQMEEDLANEYQQFLKTHNMLQHLESPKCVAASSKHGDNDSDCEIIDIPVADKDKEKEKSKFNLKTVFLNKELSIKIAKKSAEEPQQNKKNLNLKGGRHTVWINDSIMVKKVKPTQSFLAQDSRNKKPPDTKITIDMVRIFFDNYYKREKVLLTCAPFISPEWVTVKQLGVCNYFINQTTPSDLLPQNNPTQPTSSESNNDAINSGKKEFLIAQPISLQVLCTRVLQICMNEPMCSPKEYSLNTNNDDLSLKQEFQPNSLLTQSLGVISSLIIINDKHILRERTNIEKNINSLKLLCLREINIAIHKPLAITELSNGPTCTVKDFISQNKRNQLKPLQIDLNTKSLFSLCVAAIQKNNLCIKQCDNLNVNRNTKSVCASLQLNQNTKSLFSLCVAAIQRSNLCIKQCDNLNVNKNTRSVCAIKSLKSIAFKNIKNYLYRGLYTKGKSIDNYGKSFGEVLSFDKNNIYKDYCVQKSNKLLGLTIESVNTLSDDIFAKLPDTSNIVSPCLEDEISNFSDYDDEYEPGYTESNQEEEITEESNWVSQVQLKELKSCFISIDSKTQLTNKTSIVKDSDKECVMASIKIEPLEEPSDNLEPTIIKSEPTENDDINYPLETKLEHHDSDNDTVEVNLEQNNTTYDIDAFENFARCSKMLQSTADCVTSFDEIYSQSALRVRKQHEPDIEGDMDTSMSLLVPQSIELAKDRLMQSSSDDGADTSKNVTKKKRKLRSKILRQKNKDLPVSKDKNTTETEVAVLTRKMQEKIRQEEESDDSSDTELENSLALRRENSKKQLGEKAKAKTNQEIENQIQCNDVDSTENLNDTAITNEGKKSVTHKKSLKTSNRKKNKSSDLLDINKSTNEDTAYIIQPDAPVELLECEPSLPMLHDDIEDTELESNQVNESIDKEELQEEKELLPYIDRHGWRCYSVKTNDTKLYAKTYILLEKLPESFVETYFRYQNVSDKTQDDTDINRLTNLQSLNRSLSKENKVKNKIKRAIPNSHLKPKCMEADSQPESPCNGDSYKELSPSEDEEPNADDEIVSAPQRNANENDIAKSSLINDADSDSENGGNPEDPASTNGLNKKNREEPSTNKSLKSGPKSKKGIKESDSSTFLTADKMMNKELALLHAPVSLKTEETDIKEITKKPPKNAVKSSSRLHKYLDKREDEDSSSEEEKQWVTTKEKLLRRLGKKQENPSVEDAKRAKIVSEFIEKRGDATDKRPISRWHRRRSSKRFLERQKQISVLNNELFGDTTYTGRKYSQAFGKGRKNIRKVIDKKSLARSTLVANMEEFARKRRLTIQQTRLREQLGCEEGVNVLVINDEVCLEYDFEQMRPVVTIHPFFTKVMKAHQYEGVKFMWDACFESLALVGAGHAGGGCILAHCMGLGKTLQVLALLHTVLTHPGVGMKRVLVCCPLSTVLNWVDEINKWIGPVTNQIKVFELSKLKKTYERAYQLEDWYKDGGIFIIGYELFRSLTTLDPLIDLIKPKIVEKIRHALLNPGPDVVICDEGHLLKNDSSVLAVAMSRVATRRRIVLTGTPMQNNLREYYCMVNFVKPSLLGTYAEYSNRFENPIMNGQHRDSHVEDIKLMKTRTHILHKVLEGCLQRQEASVLYPYLPKKHEYTVFIPPTKCQWDLYKHYIMKYALNQQHLKKLQKPSVLKDFHVLQKIWTHPQVLHNFLMKARDERNKIKEEKLEDDLAQEDLAASEDVKPIQSEVWWLQYLEGGGMLESLDSSNKFVVVFQLLAECVALGDKVLIFSTSLYTMDALEYFLKRNNKWSLGHDYFRLDGSVPPEVRQKWCREFNAPHNVHTKLFLISTRAGCLGLNMTAANRVIILDTSWNPAHDIQSIFRVYRFGQKKDCYIYRLVAMGTMEQKIYERSVTKQAVSCRVVDEQQIDRHYNMAELTELYRYDEEGASVEAGLAAGVCDVALLRVAARARLHAVREHDSLLRGSREQHLPEHERNAAWMQFQEEHANNEMQNRLMEASQGIHRILETELAQSSGLVPVKVEEKPLTILPQTGPKGKKTKKKAATISTSPPEEPSISKPKEMKWDSEKEEAKVKKIMELLIKHNFHNSKHAQEISKLVSSVRSIVDAGGAGLDKCDELTRSIASVMLQEENLHQSSLEPPPLTNVFTGDQHSLHPRPKSIQANKSEQPHEASDGLIVGVSDEVHGEAVVEISDEAPDGSPNKPPNNNTIFNISSEESLLVPIRETIRRQSARQRKYSPRNSVESINSGTYTSTGESNDGSGSYIRKKSKRLTEKSRTSYTSDSDNCVPDNYSSRERSPEITNEAAKVPLKRNECSFRVYDDSTTRKSSKPPLVTNVREEPRQSQIQKPRRAIAVKSTAKVKIPDNNSNGKIKRRAALAAEKHLEKLDDAAIVNLDDDDDEWVDHNEIKFVSKTNTSKSTAQPETHDTWNQNKRKSSIITNMKCYSGPPLSDSKEKDSSIVLSDDEDSVNTTGSKAKNYTDNSIETETAEEIPLHPSMLNNSNFIKIVAYAYQSNRMLDEDAALLAARYSTQKALKEYETTGKTITSGPLHDIAVKVLGVDVLKKLNSKKVVKKNETSLNMNSAYSDARNNSRAAPEPESAPEATAAGRKLRSHNDNRHGSPDYKSQPNVVPVGLFRGGAMKRKAEEVVEECILPDDDEDCILGSTDEILPSTRIINKKHNSQLSSKSQSTHTMIETILPEMENTIINLVSSSNTLNVGNNIDKPHVTISERPKYVVPNTPTYQLSKNMLQIDPTLSQMERRNVAAPQTQPCLTLTISEGKLVQQVLNVASNATNKAPPTSTITQTICLDSDEEDSVPVRRLPNTLRKAPVKPFISTHSSAPTPIAVTTGFPNINILNNQFQSDSVMKQGNNFQQHVTLISPELSKNQQQQVILIPSTNFPDKSNQKNTGAVKTPPTPKVAKILPKPVKESTPIGANQAKSKIIISPQDLMKSIIADKNMKNGDIVRITKQGRVEVLSRINELPENCKATLITPLVKRTETIAEQRKPARPSAAARAPSPTDDPLSCLKDVIHIRADDYEDDTRRQETVKPIVKEANSQLTSSVTENKKTLLRNQDSNTPKTHAAGSEKISAGKKTLITPVAQTKKKEFVLQLQKNETDKKKMTPNIVLNNKSVSVLQKPTERLSEYAVTSKGAIVVGSSKDIIICSKATGNILAKATASSANMYPAAASIKGEGSSQTSDNKKRSSPWPDSKSSKRKKGGTLRLEDFDIDDLDDIIELE